MKISSAGPEIHLSILKHGSLLAKPRDPFICSMAPFLPYQGIFALFQTGENSQLNKKPSRTVLQHVSLCCKKIQVVKE